MKSNFVILKVPSNIGRSLLPNMMRSARIDDKLSVIDAGSNHGHCQTRGEAGLGERRQEVRDRRPRLVGQGRERRQEDGDREPGTEDERNSILSVDLKITF